MVLKTERTILRPFRLTDAEDLYAFSGDHRVADAAGWPPHESVADSRRIIASVFSAPNTFAVVERETGRVIGSVGFTGRGRGGPERNDELGYALHPDFWGRGLMAEVCLAVLDYGFREMGLDTVWCTHYEGNRQSRRVIEKCGFQYAFREEAADDLGVHMVRFYFMTREMWREKGDGGILDSL